MRNCGRCGEELPDWLSVCPACGADEAEMQIDLEGEESPGEMDFLPNQDLDELIGGEE